MTRSPFPARRPMAVGVGAALLAASLASPVLAGPTVGIGSTGEGTGALDLGYDWRFDLSDYHPALGARLATGVLLLEGDEGSDNQAFYLRPALRYSWKYLYLEGGIGASAFVDTQYEDRRLGSSFQFEDRLALGTSLGPYGELALSATHYSNASIKEPNDGLEVYMLNWLFAY